MDNTINFIRVFFILCLFRGNVLLCTLPSYMEGMWSDSKFYDVEFTGGTDMFLASYSITRQGTTTNMTCHISEDNKYVMRTKNTARAAVDGIDGQYYYYICMEITKITDYSFYYYLQSDIDSNSERTIPINENSTQSDTVATYCTTTIGLHLFHIMVKNGFEANAIQTCSPPLLGEFTYELTTVPGFCRTHVTTGTIGFVDESYSTFNVTEVPGNVCNFKFGNSATHHVGCLVCIKSGNIYITSLINLDGTYDNVYYYKFTCMMSVHEEDKVMLSQRARVCHADQNVNSIPDHSKLYPQDIPLAVALINLDPNGTEVTRDVICFPIHSISEGEKNLAWIAAVVIILVLIIVAIIIFIYCKKIKRGNKIKSQEPRKRKFVFDIRTALTAGLGRQKSFLRSENIVQDRKQNKVKRFEEETELNHPEETSSVNGDVFITEKTPTLVERFPTQHEITITNSKNNENSIKGVETSSEADKETFDQVVRNQGSSYKVPESKETVLIVHINKRINVGLMKDSINLVKERSHPTDVNKNIKQSNDSKENLHHIESQDYGIPLQSKVVPSDLTVTKDHFKTNGYSTESQSHDTENREHNFAIDINDTENSKNVKDDDPQHVELKDKQFIEMCKSKDHETKTSTLKTSDDKSLEQNFSTDMTENSPLTSKSIHTEINQTSYPAHDDLETTMQMSEKQIVKGKQRLISTPIVHTEHNKVEDGSKKHHSENDHTNNEIYNRDSSNKKKLATSQMMQQTKSNSHNRTLRSSTPVIHRKGQKNELEHPMYNDEKTTKTHHREVKSPLKLPFDVEIHEEEEHKPVENLLNNDDLRANKQKIKKSKYSNYENTTRTETFIPQLLSDRSAGSGAGENEIHNFLKLNLQIPEETSVKFTKQYNKYKSPISNQSLQNEKKMKIRKQILKKKSQQETATSEVQYFY